MNQQQAQQEIRDLFTRAGARAALHVCETSGPDSGGSGDAVLVRVQVAPQHSRELREEPAIVLVEGLPSEIVHADGICGLIMRQPRAEE